ncbi:MAG: hypothetical protein JWM88_666 [Verrucomicrobia bacterium]|nr:hypothetical protein [Verrucomicrobiota bacterium]
MDTGAVPGFGDYFSLGQIAQGRFPTAAAVILPCRLAWNGLRHRGGRRRSFVRRITPLFAMKKPSSSAPGFPPRRASRNGDASPDDREMSRLQDTNERLGSGPGAGDRSRRAQSNQGGVRADMTGKASSGPSARPETSWKASQQRGDGRSQATGIDPRSSGPGGRETRQSYGSESERRGPSLGKPKMRSREYGDNNQVSSTERDRRAAEPPPGRAAGEGA